MTSSYITGTQVNYYAVCHRKLWLFSHGIEMERENENVQMGKLVGEESYSRARKEIALDDRVVLDWAELERDSDGTTVVHEVKKAKSVEAAHRLQMLYYLSVLREKGVAARGQIDYPLLKKCQAVALTSETEAELQAALDGIERLLVSDEVPPRLPPAKKRFCAQCAYFEFCWS